MAGIYGKMKSVMNQTKQKWRGKNMKSTKKTVGQLLTTTIKGECLRQIVDGVKNVEYRDIKPYWDNRLAQYETPFLLRLINGMRPNAPEVIVEVIKVVKYQTKGQYWLYLGDIKSKKNMSNLVKSKD